ncbi:carbohydrate kinase family protein [Methylophilus sp. 5]|uniref:carbohydrate kinase family protein n=1 Tax=Methylophilus sp. 5 TaxID=1112274 RepID=UPI00048B84FD|nr:PfkB family carbohydrate kinase [Methylophilus sp. 5]
MSNSIMILGEVLGDVFPKETMIGGAPYNVARHCHAFGAQVRLLTAVGKDALGERILAEMRHCGLPVDGVQQSERLPTGQVMVHLEPHGHRFEILDRQAYDDMQWPPVAALTQQHPPRLVYVGSLALRHAPMQALAEQWLKMCTATVFCDINLRAPWYGANSLRLVLQATDILKINHEELPEVCALLGLPALADINEAARQLLMVFGLREVFVTCGEQGSFWLDAYGNGFRAPPMKLQAPFVDSVGAGDAYAAVVIRGLLAGWSRQTMLTRAAWFAASICSIRGAVPAQASFYDDFL